MARDDKPTAAALVPPGADLDTLREAAAGCTACPLHLVGTRTVFGEGPPDAPLMLIGEVPGDQEDKQGHPFVGPAGKLLDKCLVEAGIDRSRAYVTNVVKHFKWERSGKRRLHQKPAPAEIRACKPWAEAEIAALRPRVLVCLGSTAAQALLGKDFKVTQRRGELVESPLAAYVTATVHPSSLLRTVDPVSREAERARFVEDLARIAKYVGS